VTAPESYAVAALLETLRSMHSRDGDRPCRACLVADGYERCPTALVVDVALKQMTGREQA
jgi:hypothetical protein